VVVEVVVFRHMQRLNFYSRIIELQHQRRDLWGNGFELYLQVYKQNKMAYNLQRDIRQLNYSFDNSLQPDEVVVVVELGVLVENIVVGGLEEFVEHIVVQVLEHQEQVDVVEHMFVGVVVVVVGVVDHMLVVELEKFVVVVEEVEHKQVDRLVVVVVGVVEVEHIQVVEVDRLVEWVLQQQHIVPKQILIHL
jgi:hypothetical protein